jgi:PAS domain S-box-containing protein
LKDLDGCYLFINRTFERRFDLSRDQVIGKTDDDLFSPEQAALFRTNDCDVLRTGTSIEFEEVAQYGDGKHVSIVVKFPLRDAKETIYALCGIITDITERKKGEEALRQSEERFRLVALATNDVLWDRNLVTNEAWESPNARQLFGNDPDSKPCVEVWSSRLHPDDRARLLNSLDKAMKGREESWSGEYRCRLADGSYGYFMDRGHIVRDATGKPVRMIGAMIDVTGVKQAYASLNDAYTRLQAMSREVQAAEEKERLRLSRELHDEFGQLLSALMFDLSDIGRGAQKLRSPAASALRKKAKLAMGTVDRLFVSFREVLAALRPPVLDVLGLVPAIEALASELQERTGLRCCVVAERRDLGQVCGPDLASTIYRMAQELLMNISRHAKATETVITLNCTDGCMTLVVQDNGVGFAVQRLPQKGRFGLRGVQERAELLGGRVEIRSEPGSGTVVTVRLPVELPLPNKGAVASPRLQKS